MPGAPFRLMNATVAVTLFFIISGFYMAMVINEKYAKDEPEHWIRTFYAARFWRLYPAYFAMFLIVLIWNVASGSPSPLLQRLPMSIFEQIALMIPNFLLFGQDVHQLLVRVSEENAAPAFLLDIIRRMGPAALNNGIMVIGQAWSLALEAAFYLVAPFIVTSARKTFIWLAIAMAFRFFLLEILDLRSGIWGYFFFPGALCMFLMGSAAYHLRKLLARPDVHALVGWIALAGLAVWFTTVCLTAGIVLPSRADWSIDRPQFWALYLLFAVSVPFIFEATKRLRFDREIGELSYPLYLVHGLALGFIYFRWGAPRGSTPDAWVAVIFSIFAAYAMRHLIEVPIEKYQGHRKTVTYIRPHQAGQVVPELPALAARP